MPGRRTRRLRRTWPQRLLITFNIICIVAAVSGAAALTYAKQKVGQINRITLGRDFVGSGNLGSQDPRNFLIVGVDDDEGLDADDPASRGRENVGGVRSDTIMIVRLDPKTTGAQVLSLPRDLWVEIPGRSRNRINAALQYGGQPLLISTIKQDFGIDINHYVQVNFKAFKSLVKLIDGVPIWFPTPVKDQGGLNVEQAGCTTLDENGALQYVRARHFRYYDTEKGRFVSDPTSDYGRISRQQDFIKRVIRRSVEKGARNPFKLRNFVDVAVDNITLDGSTTPQDLVDLGLAFRNFDPNALQTFSLPTNEVVRGGAAVLEMRKAEAEPILSRFRGTSPAAQQQGEVPPGTVTVKVLNGTGKQDQASTTSEQLRRAGFQLEAPAQTEHVDQTEVRYPPGQEVQAATLARYLFAQPLLVPDPDVAVVTLVTGPDFGTVLEQPRSIDDVPVPTTTTTTTTAPASTTSVPGGTTAVPPVPGATTTTRPGYVPGDAPEGVDCG